MIEKPPLRSVPPPFNSKAPSVKEKSKDTSPEGGKAKTKKHDGLSYVDVEDALICWLKGKKATTKLDKVQAPWKMRVLRTNGEGNGVILMIRDNTAQVISAHVAAGILREFIMPKKSIKHFRLTHEQYTKVLRAFADSPADLTELPKVVAFKSDPDLCMVRLDFDPIPCSLDDMDQLCPSFASMMRRASNAEALMARIGSIFDPSADRKQAVWLHGPPDCGKSQVAYVVQKLAGKFAIICGDGGSKDAKWRAQLLGKRVAVIQEAPIKFVKGPAFKSLTGDLNHSIDEKFIPVFTVSLPILFFCMSNEKPGIDYDEALIRRIIACKMDPVPYDERIGEAEFQKKLDEELSAIAGLCISFYQKLADAGGRILSDDRDLKNSIAEHLDEYSDFIERHFILARGASTPAAFVQQKMRNFGYRTNKEIKELKEVLCKFWRVQYKQVRFRNPPEKDGIAQKTGSVRIWCYVGIRPREGDELVIVDDGRILEELPEMDEKLPCDVPQGTEIT